MTNKALFAGLNDQQLQAVTAAPGPVLVLAGPGSGKTRVLTHRIAYLMSELGVDPTEILAVTFTNKAAREMRERLESLVGYPARYLTVGTFHAVCARILRRDGSPVGLGPDFVIYDDDDQIRLLKQAIADVGLDDKQYPPRSIQSRISAAKNQLQTPEEYGMDPQSYFDEVAARVYRRYQELLEWNQAADFDDLLMKVELLWGGYPEVLERYQDRWRHVLVDEYQDTNHAQYMLIRRLTEKRRSLFVVGDEDQGIYSWRAADIRNILNFERDYPDAQVVLLEQNYRSTQAILDVAAQVIHENQGRTPKRLWTAQSGGTLVQVREAYDEQNEADYIARELTRLHTSHGYRYHEMAVMYRTNAQSRVIEERMLRYRVPYQIVGGPRFYERKEVRDVLAYLRLVHNPNDTAALRRIVDYTHSGRGIGKTTMATLDAFAAHAMIPLWDAITLAVGAVPERADEDALPASGAASAPRLAGKAKTSLAELVGVVQTLRGEMTRLRLPDLIESALRRTGYLAALNDGTPEGVARTENVEELKTVAQEYTHLEPRESLATFLEEVSLMSDVDTLRGTTDATTLITLHAAKGLEYRVVFIAGMEEGLLPHSRSLETPSAVEEERRLAYVGVTRAMERLYLSYAFHRSIFGSTQVNEPSRFLTVIPDSLVSGYLPKPTKPRQPYQPVTPIASRQPVQAVAPVQRVYAGATQAEPATLPEFSVGDMVRHEKFGEGVVTNLRHGRDDSQVEVRFAAGSTKWLSLAMARLEKV
ncbi:MAG: UvrD-helicase domain-containing protein [Chloroflexota bacterium]|nr:UvrD-helicase domain-containing protein [Chloroflexota bacterium]